MNSEDFEHHPVTMTSPPRRDHPERIKDASLPCSQPGGFSGGLVKTPNSQPHPAVMASPSPPEGPSGEAGLLPSSSSKEAVSPHLLLEWCQRKAEP